MGFPWFLALRGVARVPASTRGCLLTRHLGRPWAWSYVGVRLAQSFIFFSMPDLPFNLRSNRLFWCTLRMPGMAYGVGSVMGSANHAQLCSIRNPPPRSPRSSRRNCTIPARGHASPARSAVAIAVLTWVLAGLRTCIRYF